MYYHKHYTHQDNCIISSQKMFNASTETEFFNLEACTHFWERAGSHHEVQFLFIKSYLFKDVEKKLKINNPPVIGC